MALFVRRRWPKAVAAVGVAGALFLGGAWLTADDAGRPTRPAGANAPLDTLPAVALDALLTAPDAELARYHEHRVTAPEVPVQRVVNRELAWIGESAADRVLVVLMSTDRPFRFAAGTRLSFVGRVRPLRPGYASVLGLRGDDLAEATGQATYVEVYEYERIG